MRYFVHYDAETGHILERRPQDIEYPTPLPEPNILVSESQYLSTLCDNKRVNIETLALEDAPPIAVSLPEAKKQKKAELAAARYETETAGITVSGLSVATDDRSKALISAAAGRARADATYIVGWRKSNGDWVDLTAPEILAMEAAVAQWVEKCFARERYYCDLVDSKETVEQVQDIKWSME